MLKIKNREYCRDILPFFVLFVLGDSFADALGVTIMRNCQVVSFPFKYLGVPMSPFTLFSKDFAFSFLKVANFFQKKSC